ncbi:hypothetical protein KKG83_04035 [Candidatus Micrarchaeota archaeon]|nr:hypothetical protein [Candidatus Micrarchaeota archaeon]MBU2476615.1 hypothetical protein [Candidatus Micrarchaeota archaeon]
MAESKLFISRQNFIKQLKLQGIPQKKAEKFGECVFGLFDSSNGKYISKKDAKLILDSIKKSSPEIVEQIIRNTLGHPETSASAIQFGRKFIEERVKLKANMRFVLKNFSEIFGKVCNTKIGEFRFVLSYSVEKGNSWSINLVKRKNNLPDARLNLGVRFTKDRKPVLIVGNFQGLDRKAVEEFSQTIKLLGLRKKAISAFRFMLETLVSATPQEMRIEARNPKKLRYMYPHEQSLIGKLIEKGELLKNIDKDSIESFEKKIKIISEPEKRTREEQQIISREKQRIATTGYRMHRAVFDQTGFRRQKGKGRKNRRGALIFRRRKAA